MSWVFIALLAPAFSALGSYTDKYLLVHHQRTGGLGSVVIFSSLFGALVLPLAIWAGADITALTPLEAALLILNGCLTVGTLVTYLYAIRDSDVLSVVPVLQAVPVFGFIIGFLVLGETLTSSQIAGSVIIILSAIFLSVEIEMDAEVRFRARSFLLAMLSAFLFALSGSIFKSIASERGYWTVQFWEYVGITALGIILFACVRSYRRGFLKVVRKGRLGVAVLNFITELLTVSGDLLVNYATLLAPIALVYTVSSLQPAFLLVFAAIGVFFVPQLIHKLTYLRKHLLLKVVAIGFMVVGSIVVYTA